MAIQSIETPQLHDNLIRGINFPSDMDDFTSDIHFDIDHILEWINCSPTEGESLFSVSRALLKFHKVTDLNITLSWGDSHYSEYSGDSAGVYILDIKREEIKSPLGTPDYYKWSIITNNDKHSIIFGASSMSLELIGEPLTVNRQYLLNRERN